MANPSTEEIDMQHLSGEVSELRVMVIVLLCLVILLTILCTIILIRDAKLRRLWSKFCAGFKGASEDDPERGHKSRKGKVEISRYSCSYNSSTPQVEVIRPSAERRQSVANESLSVISKRIPSESTCPDDSQIEFSGYDNLALSTSTINYNSRPCSPRTVSPDSTETSIQNTSDSVATIDTTMTTVHLSSVRGYPQRGEVGRRSTP